MAKVSNKKEEAIKKEKTISTKLKGSLHPNYREITVEMTNGTKFKTRSTVSTDILKLDIDPATHPAWTKEANYVNTKATEVSKFNNKFKGLSFGKQAK
jgi:large subunit ribosomal protein L31